MNTNSGNLESAAKLDAVWCKNQVELEKKLAEVQAREIEALTELRKRAEELESVQAKAAEMRAALEPFSRAVEVGEFAKRLSLHELMNARRALSSDAGRALLAELEALRNFEVVAKNRHRCSWVNYPPTGGACDICKRFDEALAKVEEVRRKA